MWDDAALDLDAQANRALHKPARQLVDQLSFSATHATQGEVFDSGFLAVYKRSLRSAIARANIRR